MIDTTTFFIAYLLVPAGIVAMLAAGVWALVGIGLTVFYEYRDDQAAPAIAALMEESDPPQYSGDMTLMESYMAQQAERIYPLPTWYPGRKMRLFSYPDPVPAAMWRRRMDRQMAEYESLGEQYPTATQKRKHAYLSLGCRP